MCLERLQGRQSRYHLLPTSELQLMTLLLHTALLQQAVAEMLPLAGVGPVGLGYPPWQPAMIDWLQPTAICARPVLTCMLRRPFCWVPERLC